MDLRVGRIFRNRVRAACPEDSRSECTSQPWSIKGTALPSEKHNGSQAWVHLDGLHRGQSNGTAYREHVGNSLEGGGVPILSCSHHLLPNTAVDDLKHCALSISITAHLRTTASVPRSSLPCWADPLLSSLWDILSFRYRTLKNS